MIENCSIPAVYTVVLLASNKMVDASIIDASRGIVLPEDSDSASLPSTTRSCCAGTGIVG